MILRIASVLILTVILITAVSILPAAAQLEPEMSAAQVTVTNVTLNPGVFFEDDIGIVTIEVTNNGVESVAIRRATMYGGDITVLSQSYDTTTVIGSQNKMKFTFTVQANMPPGIYYPLFSLDFRDAGYLRYPIQIRVDDQPLTTAILEKPDVFSAGRKDRIDLLIGNPRDNPVTGVVVHYQGEMVDITPSSSFIGNLNSDQSQRVSINVTPEKPTNLNITVEYRNGVNSHSNSQILPINFGQSKTEANPVLTNLVIEFMDGHYVLTGDVYNAGLEVANSVVLTTRGDAVPVDPYRNYVVGSLLPDDFSSFELTFQAGNISSVPVAVEYRDIDGNPYEKVSLITTPTANTTNEPGPGISPLMIAIIAVSVVVIAVAIWYSWKKKEK